ncbi:21289_t:CDS:2 [Dentiscutata erythropus]|uniref:21289_t:CDS:1 n=1 Tax=Dentiscutata erythropus TaxID=1348616 RepID=A0A9N9CNE2_9GLOM|nr:21289_t:CDS:2 [Dentiscutata erythropus]
MAANRQARIITTLMLPQTVGQNIMPQYPMSINNPNQKIVSQNPICINQKSCS